MILRALRGLEQCFSFSCVDYILRDDGWFFSEREGSTTDHLYGLSKLKDIYEIIKHNTVKSGFSIGHIGKKLLERQDILKNSSAAFVDGSLYLGFISVLKEKGFMPKSKTLAFPLSVDCSIDIDTEEEFEDALVFIKKLKDLGIEYVKPRI